MADITDQEIVPSVKPHVLFQVIFQPKLLLTSGVSALIVSLHLLLCWGSRVASEVAFQLPSPIPDLFTVVTGKHLAACQHVLLLNFRLCFL